MRMMHWKHTVGGRNLASPEPEVVMSGMLILHLVAAGMLTVGNVLAISTTITARRMALPGRILPLLVWHKRLILSLVVPGSMILLGTGIWLTVTTGAPLWAGWMLGTLALWLISFAVGVFVLLPAESRAVAETQALLASGKEQVSPALRHHVAGAPVVLGEWGALVMVAMMFYLMLAKPF
jgi:predicted secreted protein